MQAVVVGPGRFQPGIKDTNWVTNRQSMAAKVPSGASEGLLQDTEGCLLEGLVTNFFVVRACLPISLYSAMMNFLCPTKW